MEQQQFFVRYSVTNFMPFATGGSMPHFTNTELNSSNSSHSFQFCSTIRISTMFWILTSGCGAYSINGCRKKIGLYMRSVPTHHYEEFAYLLIFSDNSDLERQQLGDSTCWPDVTPKLVGWSFISVCRQVNVRPAIF